MLQPLYEVALEKYAGDEEQAKAFVEGFFKEAAFPSSSFGGNVLSGAGKAVGMGAVALGLGLGVHGISSAISSMAMDSKRERFNAALAQAVKSNSILENADPEKIRSYADTIFRFAPSIAADPNLLAHVLSNTIHGESMDVTTIKALSDLESKYEETKKNRLFTPKMYT